MRTTKIIALGFLFIIFSPVSAASDSIAIEPGMWEVTTTLKSPMSEQAQVKTAQECIKDSQISPQDIAPSDDGSCSISETTVSGNSLNWSMQCDTPGGSMNGGGTFTSKGDSGSGNMHMNMDIQGQAFKMEMAWDGKRVGSC